VKISADFYILSIIFKCFSIIGKGKKKRTCFLIKSYLNVKNLKITIIKKNSIIKKIKQ